MRTPILIRDGSPPLILLDSDLILKNPEDTPSDTVEWRYTPKTPGLYRHAIVDFVGLRNCNLVVDDDGDFGERRLGIWTQRTIDGPPNILVVADSTLTIKTRKHRLVTAKPRTRRKYAFEYPVSPEAYSYVLSAGGTELGREEGLERIAFSISRRPGFLAAPEPHAGKWIALAAGAGLAAGWLLRK